LYFASDGHPGLGQLDLFVAERVGGKTSIRNLGAPFNTNFDDFALVQTSGREGFFSSNRPGIVGEHNDNLIAYNDTTPDEKPVQYLLAGRTVLDDVNGEFLLPNTLVYLEDQDGVILDSTYSDTSGVYAFNKPLELDQDYFIRGKNEPYIPGLTPFTTKDKAADPFTVLQSPGDTAKITFRTDVYLEPDLFANLENGMEEIELRGITYEFDKSELTDQAKLILDKLVNYLREHPEIAVELGSHTDSRGSFRYNMRLSKKRAESSRDYLIESGIDPGRIVSRGFGESNLKIPDASSEEEHKINRRTTVRIIN
jgi:peptidoglycan-associated lipoprotein